MIKRASELRAIAREKLKGNWLTAILACILATILGGTGGGFSFGVNSGTTTSSGTTSGSTGEIPSPEELIASMQEAWMQMPEEEKTAIITTFITLFVISTIISIAFTFLSSATELGYNKFNIDLVDTGTAEVSDVFSRFRIILKAFGLRFFMQFFIFLWSLLFFIPGIIASYRYAMAPYIMAENPDIGIREAVNMSKEMMKGYKWRYFCLDLSFIGWTLLSLFCCCIGFIWLNPYIFAARAAFYRMVKDIYDSGNEIYSEFAHKGIL